jgi:hypothetical protein
MTGKLMAVKWLRRRDANRQMKTSRERTEEALRHLPHRPLGPVLPGYRIRRQYGRPDRSF